MATQIVQARVSDSVVEQLMADAAALGLENTSDALREGIALLHRKAEQVRLARSYDAFYGGEPAPVSDVTLAVFGPQE